MAQYFTDFSEYTTGVTPSDWTQSGDTAESVIVVADVGATGGKIVQFPTENNFDRYYLSWDDVGSVSDCEILVRARLDVESNTSIYIAHARHDTTSIRDGIALEQRGGNVEILEENNTLSSTDRKWGSNEWFWVRLRVTGANFKARFWVSGTEPTTWDIEVTGTDTSSGAVGFGEDNTKNPFEIDVFGVGTGGDSAPSSAPATGPNTPVNPSITNLLATSARLNWEQG